MTALNWDGGTLTYALDVRVSDGTKSFDVPVAISVTPVNDGPPVFSPTAHTVSYAENIGVDSIIYTYAATDVDFSPHGIVEYSIITCQSVNQCIHTLSYVRSDNSTV